MGRWVCKQVCFGLNIGRNLPDDATDWSAVPGIGRDLLDDAIGWSGQCPGFVFDGIIMNIRFASDLLFSDDANDFLCSGDNSTGTYKTGVSDAPKPSDAIFGLTAPAPYPMSSPEGFCCARVEVCPAHVGLSMH